MQDLAQSSIFVRSTKVRLVTLMPPGTIGMHLRRTWQLAVEVQQYIPIRGVARLGAVVIVRLPYGYVGPYGTLVYPRAGSVRG